MEDKIESTLKIIRDIEAELEQLKKICDMLTQLRVQVALLQSEMMKVIDAHAWAEVSQLIGLTGNIYIGEGALEEKKP